MDEKQKELLSTIAIAQSVLSTLSIDILEGNEDKIDDYLDIALKSVVCALGYRGKDLTGILQFMQNLYNQIYSLQKETKNE